MLRIALHHISVSFTFRLLRLQFYNLTMQCYGTWYFTGKWVPVGWLYFCGIVMCGGVMLFCVFQVRITDYIYMVVLSLTKVLLRPVLSDLWSCSAQKWELSLIYALNPMFVTTIQWFYNVFLYLQLTILIYIIHLEQCVF